MYYYWPLGTSPKYSRRIRKTGFPGQTKPHFLQKCKQGTLHLLNVCHPGRSACRLLIISRGIAAFVCPSNLSEYSLVRLLFFRNLHWVFWVWIAMFGTRRTFWQHSCFRKLRFVLHNQFCRFFKLKQIWVPPYSPCSKGPFIKIFGNFKSCDISFFSS